MNKNGTRGQSIFGSGYVELLKVSGGIPDIVRAARISYGKETKGYERDLRLVRFLIRNEHLSPFRHVNLTYRLKVPIFVARQLMRHHVGIAWNEISRRYTNEDMDFYNPGEPGIDSINTISYDTYNRLLNNGVPKERARVVLPVGTFTTLVMTANLNAMINLWRERLRPEAQEETRSVAALMYRLYEQEQPDIASAIKLAFFNRFPAYLLENLLTNDQLISLYHRMLNEGFTKPDIAHYLEQFMTDYEVDKLLEMVDT